MPLSAPARPIVASHQRPLPTVAVGSALLGKRVHFTAMVGEPPKIIEGVGTVTEASDSGSLVCVKFDKQIGLFVQRWVAARDCIVKA